VTFSAATHVEEWVHGMVNHDEPLQLRGRRAKVGSGLQTGSVIN